MSSIWPFDIYHSNIGCNEAIRPFRCLLFMPFASRFDRVADVLRETVTEVIKELDQLYSFGFINLPEIKRLDWIKEAGVIHSQIWQELISADLVFCDITGYNPNVMYELGVACGWKKSHQLVLIKNKNTRDCSAFDISPIRYIEYDPENIRSSFFTDAVKNVTQNVLIGYPDETILLNNVELPLHIDFSNRQDDDRLYTPPFCHRRVCNEIFEFGSLYSFPHSWASISNMKISNFTLQFKARFLKRSDKNPKIGVALRSQNFYPNYGHTLSLYDDGQIFITQPDENKPRFYSDKKLRPITKIDPEDLHSFSVRFTNETLQVSIDNFVDEIKISDMPKVFGPGLIRFQAVRSWMGIYSINLDNSE